VDDAVAFAGGAFELLAIENTNRTVVVFDDVFFLQGIGGEADAGTIGAQHGGEEIMGDAQQTVADAILREQKPAREALLKVVQSIATGSLGDLQSVDGGVAAQGFVKSRTGG